MQQQDQQRRSKSEKEIVSADRQERPDRRAERSQQPHRGGRQRQGVGVSLRGFDVRQVLRTQGGNIARRPGESPRGDAHGRETRQNPALPVGDAAFEQDRPRERRPEGV